MIKIIVLATLFLLNTPFIDTRQPTEVFVDLKASETSVEPLQTVLLETKQELSFKPIQPNLGPVNPSYPLPGECVTLVAQLRNIPAGWGSAINWKTRAQQAGWYVGPAPIPGAVGWKGNHVVYVLEVRPTTVLIREANFDYQGSVRTIERPISYFTYLY